MAIADVTPGSAGGFEKLAVAGSAVGFSSANYSSGPVVATRARIFCQTGSVFCRWDGSDPDGTTGFLMNTNTVLELNHPMDIARFRAIQNVGATLHAIFYR